MTAALLDQLLSSPTPFDDIFDNELLPCGPTIEPMPIWTNCGRRIDLEARCFGWLPLGLRHVISDADANWNGTDDASWELETMGG